MVNDRVDCRPESRFDWYHWIELRPGEFTQGAVLSALTNIALGRQILRRVTVEGATCLDIGAMDGLFSLLLHRRGAQTVIACDRYNRRAEFEFVCDALDTRMLYLSQVSIADVRRIAPHLIGNPFDLIIFSGVLYHMYDPMNGLALVRSMVRPGGIVIVETNVSRSTEPIAHFNIAGSIVPDPHNYWNVSVALLDYLLRYFRLMPLDCLYHLYPDGRNMRLCTPCRAVEHSLADEGDTFMDVPERADNFDYPIWSPRFELPLVAYEPGNNLIRRPNGAIDLLATVNNSAPAEFSERDIRLELAAKY